MNTKRSHTYTNSTEGADRLGENDTLIYNALEELYDDYDGEYADILTCVIDDVMDNIDACGRIPENAVIAAHIAMTEQGCFTNDHIWQTAVALDVNYDTAKNYMVSLHAFNEAREASLARRDIVPAYVKPGAVELISVGHALRAIEEYAGQITLAETFESDDINMIMSEAFDITNAALDAHKLARQTHHDIKMRVALALESDDMTTVRELLMGIDVLANSLVEFPL